MLLYNIRITDTRYAHDGISVETIGRYIRVKTRYGISILWDGEGAADIALDNDQYRGSLGGLCGNFNSNPVDDMVMRDGENVDGCTCTCIDRVISNWRLQVRRRQTF